MYDFTGKVLALLFGFAILVTVIGGCSTFVKEEHNKNHTPAKDIKVISPNGGESWSKDQNVHILWNAAKEIKFVNIRLAVAGNEDSQNFNAAIASDIPNTGDYEWTVQDLYVETWGIKSLPVSDKYLIIVEDSEHNDLYDKSDAMLSIK
jgi:hypothetical protein